ncbi:MAG: hypothetical protein HYY50_04625 [Candidatus Kerfeldbacteria bacterium]|nr:hypothetical protein [Candidatus Kerfeldbacteria bacterium]
MESRRVELSVTFLRAGKRYVAFSPALDLSTSGKTFAEARRHFEEAADLFLTELDEMGTLDQTLTALGWRKLERRWTPPVLVAQENSQVRIPA